MNTVVQSESSAAGVGVVSRGRTYRVSSCKFIRHTALAAVGLCSACAVDALGVDPEWVEVVEQPLLLKDLPQGLVGLRIVQISDLHRSATVSHSYLERCLLRVNHLEPDVVVLTGDYVTHDLNGRYRQQIVEMLGALDARLGVYGCLGNHDYGLTRPIRRPKEAWANFFVNGLADKDIRILRNEAQAVDVAGDRLWLAGTGDLWAGDFKLGDAMQSIPGEEFRILLAHNPDCADHLGEHRADAILSGHTHGGQVRLPWVGAPILPIKNKQYDAGLFQVNGRKLYVNRGLGRVGRIRFNCRPEITVLTLGKAAAVA